MYFNKQNRPRTSVYGCSSTSLILLLVLGALMIFGGFFFIFRYLGLIIVLGLVIWLFRKFINRDKNQSSETKQQHKMKGNPWSRDFENEEESSYDNLEREFEEVDEEDENIENH